MAQQKLRRDPLERRTIWVLALAVIAFVLPSSGFALYGGLDWWNAVIWIVGNSLLVFAIAAAALALTPTSALMPASVTARRPEILAVGLLLLWLGLVLVLVNLSILVVDAIGESSF